MRILILSYIYAPDLSPRAYRWACLAKYWAAQGHQVTVISGWKAGDLRSEVLDGVQVHRVGGALVERLKGALGQRTHGNMAGIGDRQGQSSAKFRLRRLAKLMSDRVWAPLRWPDYAAPWIFPVHRKARQVLDGPGADFLVSVSHPFSGHVAALGLRPWRRLLPWLADMGDPFSQLTGVAVNNPRLYGGLNRRVERLVLERCDAASVTHQGCGDYLERLAPGCGKRLTVIGPLLSLPPPADPATLPDSFFLPGRHLVFLGTLYKKLRNPRPLLHLVTVLRRDGDPVHLHLCGSLNDCADDIDAFTERLGGVLHVHGMLPRAQAAAAMQAAHLLVNLDNASETQIPSKLVEYVAAGRPILNIVAHSGGGAARFLADYPATCSIDADRVGQTESLARVRALLNGPSPPPCLDQFGISAIGAGYDSVRDRLLSPDSIR